MDTERIRAEATRTVEWLQKLNEDRGAMAALRGIGIFAREMRAWPVLSRIGGLEDRTKEDIAGLFARGPSHIVNADEGNIGVVCAKLAQKHSTFDLRFRRLLACDRRELPVDLRRIVMAAAANDVDIDYTELYFDMKLWSDSVRRRWATNYYRRYEPANAKED